MLSGVCVCVWGGGGGEGGRVGRVLGIGASIHTHTILPMLCPSDPNQTCMKHNRLVIHAD